MPEHRPRREQSVSDVSAGGGDRTHTPISGPRILSPVRLPVPPPRPEAQHVELADSNSAALVRLVASRVEPLPNREDLILQFAAALRTLRAFDVQHVDVLA